jgi:hypothetical protein
VFPAGLYFFHLAVLTLRGDTWETFDWRTPWKDVRGWSIFSVIVLVLGFGFLSRTVAKGKVFTPIPWLEWWPDLDLSNVDVSVRPAGWRESSWDEGITKKPLLSRRNLRHAQAQSAFLVMADLRGADLTQATLTDARMQGAWLQHSSLRGAQCLRLRLQAANLRNADLGGADLREADLRQADLTGANLKGVQLAQAVSDKSTKWPLGFKPPNAVMKETTPSKAATGGSGRS